MTIDEIIFNENKEKLTISYEQFSKLSDDEKSNKLDNTDSSFSFIYSNPNLTKTYLDFISASTDSDSDAIYVLLCVLSISLGYKKATYDNLFTELRMRDIYSLAKNFEEFNNTLFIISKEKDITTFIKGDKFISYIRKVSKFEIGDLVKVLPVGEIEEDIKSGSITTKSILSLLIGNDKTKELFSRNNVKKVMKWGQWKELPSNIEILNDNHK